MIVPELKSLSYDSAPPEDLDNCCVYMVAAIGSKGGDAADYFYFNAVTPSYLLMHWPFWGKHALVVGSFDVKVIERTVSTLLEGIRGASWLEVAAALGGYMEWEFHDYSQQGLTSS